MQGLRIQIVDDRSGLTREHAFSRFPVRLGRNPLNDLVIDEPFVSQFHAVIELHDGAMHLRDLGSKNGILLPDRPVPSRETVPLAIDDPAFSISHLRFDLTRDDVSDEVASRSPRSRFQPQSAPVRMETTKTAFLSDLGLKLATVQLTPSTDDSMAEPTLQRALPMDDADTSVDGPSEVTQVRDDLAVMPVPMPTLDQMPGPIIEHRGVEGVTDDILEPLHPLVTLRDSMRKPIARLHPRSPKRLTSSHRVSATSCSLGWCVRFLG